MHLWHSHASDGCIPTATSKSNSIYGTPVSAIAVFQPRPATINSDQRSSNSNYDTTVSAIAVYQQQLAGQQPQF